MTPERRAWHFSRTINWDTVIAFLLMLGAIATVWYNGKQQADSNTKDISHLHETDQRHESDLKELKNDIRESLKGINKKLDRLTDRRR